MHMRQEQVVHVWSWGELDAAQQAVVSEKMAACGAPSLEMLSRHCLAVMAANGRLEIAISMPLDGFAHPDMESK